jgi:osmotically-inducible protein OsmY
MGMNYDPGYENQNWHYNYPPGYQSGFAGGESGTRYGRPSDYDQGWEQNASDEQGYPGNPNYPDYPGYYDRQWDYTGGNYQNRRNQGGRQNRSPSARRDQGNTYLGDYGYGGEESNSIGGYQTSGGGQSYNQKTYNGPSRSVATEGDYQRGRTRHTSNSGASTAGPYYDVGPRNYKRPDSRISDDICDRLTQHGQLDASGIQVNVTDGVVNLDGRVGSRQDKRLAERIADSVSGVNDVNNNLKIQDQGKKNER